MTFTHQGCPTCSVTFAVCRIHCFPRLSCSSYFQDADSFPSTLSVGACHALLPIFNVCSHKYKIIKWLPFKQCMYIFFSSKVRVFTIPLNRRQFSSTTFITYLPPHTATYLPFKQYSTRFLAHIHSICLQSPAILTYLTFILSPEKKEIPPYTLYSNNTFLILHT